MAGQGGTDQIYSMKSFFGVKIITKSICFLYMTRRLSFFYSNVQKTYGPVKWSAFITYNTLLSVSYVFQGNIANL